MAFRFMLKCLGMGLLFASLAAQAEIQKELVSYKDGKTELEGYLVYDDSWSGKRPVVLIIHQWMGLSDNEKMRAEMLAKEGYVAFAIDIYGKANSPKDQKEAAALSGSFKEDTKLFRKRIQVAQNFIRSHKKVDSKKIVVSGYCFGGTGALEAARAGLSIVGAVSFHGGLGSKTPKDAKKVKGKVLVLHGAIDPYVPAEEVNAFMKEMNDAKVDYQFVAYSGAVHAFTQKEAGNDSSKGAAYNEAADKRSWQAFLNFLKEVAPI